MRSDYNLTGDNVLDICFENCEWINEFMETCIAIKCQVKITFVQLDNHTVALFYLLQVFTMDNNYFSCLFWS